MAKRKDLDLGKVQRAKTTLEAAGYFVYPEGRVLKIGQHKMVPKSALDNTEQRDELIRVFKLSSALEFGRYLNKSGAIKWTYRELAEGDVALYGELFVVLPKGVTVEDGLVKAEQR
jgi:hypothetical protein